MVNMKIIRVLLGVAILVVIFAYKSGAPAGSTCAPMESSCATNGLCHSSTPNTGNASFGITIMGGVPVGGYIPGTTYTMMPWIIDTARPLFGFQIVAKKSDGSGAGSSIISSPVKTKLIGANGLEYVEQTSAGTLLNGMHDWMYDWTAPVAGSGKITFYAAFVAANGNSASSGDDVYIDSLVIPEKSTGIHDMESAENKVSLFPNPAKERVLIHFNQYESGPVVIKIMNLTGRLVYEESLSSSIITTPAFYIPLTHLQEGMYLMQIFVNHELYGVKKFAKIQ